MKNYLLICASFLILCACGNKNEPRTKIITEVTAPDTITKNTKSHEPEGILGIIEIPEILTLSVKDSSKQTDVGFAMGQAYNSIESDMQELDLNSNEMPIGALYYNNDPENFVFECVIPINKLPVKQPKHSIILVLEATRALVYNYYGPYNKMSDAYTLLYKYIKDNKLIQTGLAREFYLSDPATEKDPQNWLSKIYIPVK